MISSIELEHKRILLIYRLFDILRELHIPIESIVWVMFWIGLTQLEIKQATSLSLKQINKKLKFSIERIKETMV